MPNRYVKGPSDLVTPHTAIRSGFLEYALRKSKESIPYLDRAKALKVILEERTKHPRDILAINGIQNSCFEAAGISVKASNHLNKEDREAILKEFIKEILEPVGEKYIDELVYRYLLTLGDALGGRMRNLVGAFANEKLTRSVISQLQVLNIDFDYFNKKASKWLPSKGYSIDQVTDIRSIKWRTLTSKIERQIIYNLTVPIVKKNIDLVVINQHIEILKGTEFRKIISQPTSYEIIGELKGGIDPAGADEH